MCVYVCVFVHGVHTFSLSLSLSRTHAQKHTPTRHPTHTHTTRDPNKTTFCSNQTSVQTKLWKGRTILWPDHCPVHFVFCVATETQDIASAGLSLLALLVQTYKYCVWPGLENKVSRQASERGQDPPLTQASAESEGFLGQRARFREGKTQASFGEGKTQASFGEGKLQASAAREQELAVLGRE
jgi:hypothetical protein